MTKHDNKFKLSNGIIPWLESLKGNVKAIEPLEVFKVYKPLDRGNTKLAMNILSFNLLPVTTCEHICEGCYDIRSMRYTSVRKKRYINTSMAMYKEAILEEKIFNQIKRSRTCEYVRLHVGGDFYSKEYVALWGRIVKRVNEIKPTIKFYTYTKTGYTDTLKGFGINVVKSDYDGVYNYAELEEVKALAKKHKGVVCPATLGKVENGFCGSKCTACMKLENVFFKKH
ncbi:MAG: hypothetical protein KAH32_09275 [Chlamydiia bacterium]|nr:hypothetical protein [Chlamydiia bacterium]